MNRNVVLTVMFPVLFFLVTLGMRNPDLKRNPGPKPRPRAVVENVETTPKEICSEQTDDVHPSVPPVLALPEAVFSFFNRHFGTTLLQVALFLPSRASPRTPV